MSVHAPSRDCSDQRPIERGYHTDDEEIDDDALMGHPQTRAAITRIIDKHNDEWLHAGLRHLRQSDYST